MDQSFAPGARHFNTTQWSLVIAARGDDTQGRMAMEALCRDYWYPLYAFARRRGYASADAKDLTQGFFAFLLEKDALAQASRERGKLRTFLLSSMQHYLADAWDHARAQKRGGGRVIEWDALDADERYAAEPATLASDAESLFDKRWAQLLVERSLAQLRKEHEASNKLALFEALRSSLTGSEPPREQTMQQLNLSESALKAAVHRLRQRYREIIRAEVMRTVASSDDVEGEMRYLASLLRQ